MKVRASHVYQSDTAEGFVHPLQPSTAQISFYPNENEVMHVVLSRKAFERLARQMIHSLEQVPLRDIQD